MSMTKLTRISFRTLKDHMLKNLCHYQSDLENPNPATNDRTTFRVFLYSILVSPVILYSTKIIPLKSYKKCFLFHLNCTFGSGNIRHANIKKTERERFT